MENNRLNQNIELIHQFRKGEQKAFAAVYTLYYKRILYFSRRYVSETEAQDITTESFVKLWSLKESFDDIKKISSFLFVTARNLCFNILRHEQVKKNHASTLAEHLESTEEDALLLIQTKLELVDLLQAEISKLPEKMREVFLLFFRDGLKPAQIAEKLQISVKTVKNQKLTALKLLRKAVINHPLEIVLILIIRIETIANGISV